MLLLAMPLGPVLGGNTEHEARQAALTFGSALTGADASSIRPLLPSEGKIQLTLDRLGPERGHFSPHQVEALLGDFLAQGTVRAFEILRLECEGSLALVHGEASLIDRRGRRARVEIHLAFRSDGESWQLREIRELSP